MYSFDDSEVTQAIRDAAVPDQSAINKIVNKPFNKNGSSRLSLGEVASLLKCIQRANLFDRVIQAANEIKGKVFGQRVKTYIPVYLSNKCSNNCTYCGFRRDNGVLKRKTLTLDEWKREISVVLEIGHRNIEVVLGSHPPLNGEALSAYIRVVAEELSARGGGSVILMSEPLEVNEYRLLKASGLSEVYCWQETYNRQRYAEVHPQDTHKGNYEYRIAIFERIAEAGIKRYGMGVLFGLYDWEYDILALVQHAHWLEQQYGILPCAIGIPRFKKAGASAIHEPFCKVTDDMYRLAVAVYRLAFPFAHIYMNTREQLKLIRQLLKGGGSEVNIEATTVPGGYAAGRHTVTRRRNGKQFSHHSYDSKQVFDIFKKDGMEPLFR